MAGTYDSTVNAFYLAYYGRPADPAGLAYWSQALAQSGGDFGAIVDAFSTSAEARSHFSSDNANDHIAGVYQQLFGRSPDQAGLDYWTNAIKSGSVTLADAAIQIMNGALSTDAQVSALRQEAAAQFTAQVAAAGVAYDGNAAVEAARVLIAAVTPTTSAADIKSLVSASASLVQTAHDNPAVIAALAKGGDLTGVLATTAGKADPVAVVQALASIAKAAVHDSAGLSTLLKGGGVADLVNSLPAGTTLQDVTKAVESGGLAAGTVVAAPPAVPATAPAPVETAPVITPKIAFSSADGHDLPLGTTLVANSIWYFVDVPRPTKDLPVFQLSDSGKAGTWVNGSEVDALSDGTHYIRYQIKGTNGVYTASNALKLVIDSKLAAPTLQLSHDTGTLDTDGLTSNGEVKVGGLGKNETWTYSFDGKKWLTGQADANGIGTIADTGADGVRNLLVQTQETTDKGTAFATANLQYTVDTSAPGQGLKLASVTYSNATHADVVFSYTGHIDAEKSEALFYLIDSYEYKFANSTVLDAVNKTVTFKNVDLSHGDAQILIETKDGAGNTLDVQAIIDGPQVTPTIALLTDTGMSATDHITSDGNLIIANLKRGAGNSWEYSFDNDATWVTGEPANVVGQANIYMPVPGDHTVLVRSIDPSGVAGATASLHYTFEPFLSTYLGLDAAINDAGEYMANSQKLDFKLTLFSHADDVTTTYEVSTTGKQGDFSAWNPAHVLAEGTYYFRANVVDPAGNIGTSNTVLVHIDNTAPSVPTVALSYDSGVQGDAITLDNQFEISGLETNASFDYSLDNGKTWLPGYPADANGNAFGYADPGEQTIVVRARDGAGNVSAASAPLHFTYDPHRALEGLKFDHIVGEADGAVHTSQTKADVVFTYTGTFVASDSLTYVMNGIQGTIDAAHIDPDNKTITLDMAHKMITLHDVDLAASPQLVGIEGDQVTGIGFVESRYISGPVAQYWTRETSAGLGVGNVMDDDHIYLTRDGRSEQIGDTVSFELVNFGAQTTVVQGVLGVGQSTATQTSNTHELYVLGTNGADTLTGTHVWGFDGDDTITIKAGGMIFGGAGADSIHAEGVSGSLIYGPASDSSIASDTDPNAIAHGFDTVYVNGGQEGVSEFFMFQDVSISRYTSLVGADHGALLTGTETGGQLLALLNTAVADTFKPNIGWQQAALIDFGHASGNEVNFLVVDSDGDGKIGADDYVVKIVGTVDSGSIWDSSALWLSSNGTVA